MRRIDAAICLLILLCGSLACGRSAVDTGLNLFPVPAEDTINFWGHATCFIDVDGFGIITDPVFEVSSYVWLQRRVPIPSPQAYAATRLILISHAHADHLNPETLAGMPSEAVILCPEPVVEYLDELPHEIVRMRLWDEREFPGGRVVAVPASHPGGRFLSRKGEDGRALGYVIITPEVTLYWSGDTSYFDGMEEIGNRYRPDLAILDINGHLKGDDVLRSMAALRTTRVLPVHHGAYGKLFFPPRMGPRDAEQLRRWLGPMLLELNLGESLRLSDVKTARGETP